jgi:gliding motility-associated-like protein
MKTKLLLAFVALLLFCPFHSYSQNIEWVQHAGTKDKNTAYSVATDAEGNSFITGHFHESINFGGKKLVNSSNAPGSFSAFIAKLDPAGNVIWAKNGLGLVSRSYAVTVDKQGNSYMAGYTFDYVTFGDKTIGIQVNSELFVAKYSSNGELQWITTDLASYDFGRDLDIKVDAAGNCYVAGGIIAGGYGSEMTYYNTSYVGGYIFKLNAEGKQVYRAGLGNITAYNLALSESGEKFYVLGNLVKTGYIDDNRPVSAGMTDIVLASYNATSGKVEWIEKFGSSSEELGTGLEVDKQGNIYISGTMTADLDMQGKIVKAKGGVDILLAKLNQTGTVLWAQNAGSTTDDYVTNLALDKSESPYITGTYSGTATFGTKSYTAISTHGNIYIAKYTPSGALDTFFTLGGTGKQVSKHITFDEKNNLFFVGSIADDVAFGQITVKANSDELFVAKIKAESLIAKPIPTEPVVNYKATLPNIITPNGDGLNDTFVTSGFTGDQIKKTFTVFNRYGAKVYQNNNYQDNWDASGVAGGVYFYTLSVHTGGESSTYKGWVEVIR